MKQIGQIIQKQVETIRERMNMREVLKVRKYKAGYEVREVRVSGDDAMGSEPLTMKEAYTPSGDYIGSPKIAHMLCKKMGIAPQKKNESINICSIGFCEEEKKWYGWSHRAIYGFEIGSEVKRGDCAYSPTDKDDFLEDCVRFWSDEWKLNTRGEHSSNIPEYCEGGNPGEEIEQKITYGPEEFGVLVSYERSQEIPNEKLRGETVTVFSVYPEEYGKGEWKAETLEDAKQMAVDFANGVA